ncbi:glycosyltransferase family 4 protein [Canibacter sp. lx-72]|uniref:glycosyltransferase family 4 protein n=1 Tax=Canibacter zhuwentaonis TaxID=2837491 RepID=UPI001BDD14DF|nr:glycosyltransferase family 4 protein [Canibacter zhuwentaonis]MBT1018052.1 glycosyltransferase family 4 protein [Canibacter zhuwentaonis]
MRVAFLVNNYPPHSGGVELHVQALAREMAAAGAAVTVITLENTAGNRVENSVEIISLPATLHVADIFSVPTFKAVSQIKKILSVKRISLISVHTRFFPLTILGVYLGKKYGIPTILTEHGSNFVFGNSKPIALASRIVDLTLGKYAHRNATKVLGVSEASCDFVKRLSNVDAEVFYNAINGITAPTKIIDRPKHLVFLGRLIKVKGWIDFLLMAQQLKEAGEEFTADIIGDGLDFEAARAAIVQMGLKDTVRLHGHVKQPEVQEMLRGATLINPTRLAEGFQTILLEALDNKGRIVTYPAPGTLKLSADGAPIVITEGKNPAALVAGVRKIWHENPAPWQQQNLIDWKWQKRAAQYLKICREVLSQNTQEDPHETK